MFSPEFMRYLIGYQKDDFKSDEITVKEIPFKTKKGKLADIRVSVKK